MNCTAAKQLLHLYLDHQLEQVEARTLEQHVAECPDCRSEFLLLERSFLGLESLERVVTPKQVYTNTMTQVLAHHSRSQRTGQVLRSVSHAAVVVVAVVGFFFALTSNMQVPAFLTALDVDGFLGVVDSALAMALTAEVSFIAGIGLMFAACSVALLQLIMRYQGVNYRERPV